MVGTTPRPVVVGTYSIGAPTGGPSGGEATIFANAFLVKSDAQCMSVVPSTDTQATSGTITITSMSASGVVGSYSATFKDGTISGAFNALFCTLPDSGAPMSDDAGGPTCVQ